MGMCAGKGSKRLATAQPAGHCPLWLARAERIGGSRRKRNARLSGRLYVPLP